MLEEKNIWNDSIETWKPLKYEVRAEGRVKMAEVTSSRGIGL